MTLYHPERYYHSLENKKSFAFQTFYLVSYTFLWIFLFSFSCFIVSFDVESSVQICEIFSVLSTNNLLFMINEKFSDDLVGYNLSVQFLKLQMKRERVLVIN